MNNQTKEIMMKRALFLAQKGAGHTSPNPMVGCVIMNNDEIIGEGYHHKYGEKHAEVEAVDSIKDKKKINGATVFVSLEPCSHFGKTPPCVDLLIKHQVKKVIIAQKDVNKKVNGKSISLLEQAGVEVEIGVCEKENQFLNRRFITFHHLKRPYIILKWAQTKDGFLNKLSNDNQWISSLVSRKITHLWRSEESAILVGRNTVEHDNPHLGVRNWVGGKHPLRIVIDPHHRLSKDYQIFNKNINTLQVVYDTYQQNNTIKKVDSDICFIPKKNFLKELMNILYARKVLSVLVEGGSFTLQQFLANNLWDECRVYTSQILTKGTCKAPDLPIQNSYYHKQERIDTDILETVLR